MLPLVLLLGHIPPTKTHMGHIFSYFSQPQKGEQSLKEKNPRGSLSLSPGKQFFVAWQGPFFCFCVLTAVMSRLTGTDCSRCWCLQWPTHIAHIPGRFLEPGALYGFTILSTEFTKMVGSFWFPYSKEDTPVFGLGLRVSHRPGPCLEGRVAGEVPQADCYMPAFQWKWVCLFLRAFLRGFSKTKMVGGGGGELCHLLLPNCPTFF